MPITLKRAHEKPAPADGYRVLVDRLWPRGVSKTTAKIDQWLRDAAPSTPLRKSFHSGTIDWNEFRMRYLAELKKHRDQLRPLAQQARRKRITLIFSARNEKHNNAVVLKQYLNMLGAG